MRKLLRAHSGDGSERPRRGMAISMAMRPSMTGMATVPTPMQPSSSQTYRMHRQVAAPEAVAANDAARSAQSRQ